MEGCRWRELIAGRGFRRDQAQPLHGAARADPHGQHLDRRSAGRLRGAAGADPGITIVESDGARYPAEAAFENNGVYPLAAELGLKVLNLSKDELVEMPDPRLKGFGMARTWLEADAS